MDELFEKMQKLIVEKLDIDAAKVTLDASFRNDLGADSLDTYELGSLLDTDGKPYQAVRRCRPADSHRCGSAGPA